MQVEELSREVAGVKRVALLVLVLHNCLCSDLAIGTKLQAIIAWMVVEITEKHTIIHGMPVVKLSDEHFWFGKPHMVLHLIHFALFQNRIWGQKFTKRDIGD